MKKSNVSKGQRKPKGQSRIDNLEAFGTRHKQNKTKTKQKKNNKQTNKPNQNKTGQNPKKRIQRQLKFERCKPDDNNRGEFRCSGRVGSFCSIHDTRRVSLVTNPMIS